MSAEVTTVGVMLARQILSDLSIASYESNIRSARRRLWTGLGDIDEFILEMIEIMERGFEQAARQGESECGILPGERSIKGTAALTKYSTEQLQYIEPFAEDIERGSKANGGLLSATDYRVRMWVNRYNEVSNLMRTIECADRKYEWVVGPTEHCPDCIRLNGKVKRGSTWEASGIRPQMRGLNCGGFNCECELVPTDKPLSRGPLPKLKGPSNLTVRLVKDREGRKHLTYLMTCAGWFTPKDDFSSLVLSKKQAVAVLESEG